GERVIRQALLGGEHPADELVFGELEAARSTAAVAGTAGDQRGEQYGREAHSSCGVHTLPLDQNGVDVISMLRKRRCGDGPRANSSAILVTASSSRFWISGRSTGST